jgi:hypothetical protein
MPFEGAGSRPPLNMSPVPKEKSAVFFPAGTQSDSQESKVGNHGTKALFITFLGMTDFTATVCLFQNNQGFLAPKQVIPVMSRGGYFKLSINNILEYIK